MIKHFIVVQFDPYNPKHCPLGRHLLVEIEPEDIDHIRIRVPVIALEWNPDQYIR